MRFLIVALLFGSVLALEGFSANTLKLAEARGLYTPPSPVSDSPKLYLFNGSNVVPGSNSLLEFDLDTKKFTTISTNNYAQNDCFSASVVCGETYYAVWTFFPAAAGVLKVDINTGKYDYLPTGGESYIYHSLKCNPQNSSALIGFASQMNAGPKGSVQFQLVHLDTTTGDTTMIGKLPEVVFGGYEQAFQFSPDGTELYASFEGGIPPSRKPGNLYILDVATGSIKEHHKIPRTYGSPYIMYTTGSNDFHGAFMDTDTSTITFCAITKKSSGGGLFPPSLKLTNCRKENSLFTGSAPMPVCGKNTVYAVPNNIGGGPGSSQPLLRIDATTGESTTVVDLATIIPGSYIGSVACA